MNQYYLKKICIHLNNSYLTLDDPIMILSNIKHVRIYFIRICVRSYNTINYKCYCNKNRSKVRYHHRHHHHSVVIIGWVSMNLPIVKPMNYIVDMISIRALFYVRRPWQRRHNNVTSSIHIPIHPSKRTIRSC